MYSSLPVIVFVECVLGRRSVGAALSLSRNRMLYLKSDPLFPLPAQILLYLLPNWCMVGGLVVCTTMQTRGSCSIRGSCW